MEGLVRLARQGDDRLRPGIVERVGMLEVDNTTASSASARADKSASSTSVFGSIEALTEDDALMDTSDSDIDGDTMANQHSDTCTVLGATCRCPACVITIDIDSDGDCSTMPIPNAKRGGQKLALAAGTPAAGSAPAAGLPAAGSQPRVRLRRKSFGIAVPAKMVVRKPTSTRAGEAYLLDANGKYIVGAGHRHSDYECTIANLLAQVNARKVMTRVAAKRIIDDKRQ